MALGFLDVPFFSSKASFADQKSLRDQNLRPGIQGHNLWICHG